MVFAGIGAGAYGSGDVDNAAVIQKETLSRLIPVEENKITKEYITALALDGLYRVYKTGLKFTYATGKFRGLGKIDATLMHAFKKNSLLDITSDEWYTYKKDIKDVGLIDGYNKVGIVFDQEDFTKLVHKDGSNSRFFRYHHESPWDIFGYRSLCYPSPLALIYWGIKNIGVNLLHSGDAAIAKPSEIFENLTLEVVKLIDEREAFGELAYISTMAAKLKEMQVIIDKYSRKKMSVDTSIPINFINLHLTEEGAAELGQNVYEHLADAYALSASGITDEQAIELVTYFAEVLKVQNVDKPISLGEVVFYDDSSLSAIFDKMKKKHSEIIPKDPQQKLSITGAVELVQRSLKDYFSLDSRGMNKDKDTLKDAFHIGRILQEDEGTIEYDVKQREEERLRDIRILEDYMKRQNNPALTEDKQEL
jgi:hypothetical protein